MSESQTRRDLLETIESQRESLSKYERRLRDVVRAYRGIAKEKEALEETLKAISGAGEDDKEEEGAVEEGAEQGDVAFAPGVAPGGDDASSTASGGSGSAAGATKRGSSEAKVRTLTASIATLTAEKTRLEAAYQDDRRKLLQERKESERATEELRKELSTLRSQSKKESEESKSKLIVERHERERESSEHAVMARELQKALSEERRGRERAEDALREAEERCKQLESGSARTEEQERRAKVLEGKLKFKTEEVTKLEKKLRETRSVEVEGARRRLEEARAQHGREVQRQERRAEEAEARAVAARVDREQRVNALEARLQELSETVGTYDRLRQHDQAEIDRLREQIQDKALEEAVPVEKKDKSPAPPELKEENLGVQELLDRFYRIKAALREANDKAKSPVDLESLMSDGDSASNWRQKYEDLSAQFETFKLESQSRASPASSGKAAVMPRYMLPEVDQEVVLSLRTQISELQDKCAGLRSQLLEREEALRRAQERERDLNAALAAAKQSSKDRLESVESDFRSKVLGLEAELQKQRERCLVLIEEKEDEVNMLKSNMEMAFEKTFAAAAAAAAAATSSAAGPSPLSPEQDRELQLRRAAASTIASTAGSGSGRKSRRSSQVSNRHRSGGELDAGGEDALTERLKASSSPNEGMVLHYVQELSHKEVEIGNLRRQVFEVEAAMRELQMNAVAKEEKYVDQIDELSESVARLKRGGGGGGGANLEYLKNVVLSYMLSSDSASRDHMLKAIGAVLIFSGQEVKQVRDHNLSWLPGPVVAAKKGHK